MSNGDPNFHQYGPISIYALNAVIQIWITFVPGVPTPPAGTLVSCQLNYNGYATPPLSYMYEMISTGSGGTIKKVDIPLDFWPALKTALINAIP